MKNELLGRLNKKTAVIGIVGLGYVGLPLMLRYCEVGYKVIGFDIDQRKVDALSEGRSYIEHIRPRRLPGPLERALSPPRISHGLQRRMP